MKGDPLSAKVPCLEGSVVLLEGWDSGAAKAKSTREHRWMTEGSLEIQASWTGYGQEKRGKSFVPDIFHAVRCSSCCRVALPPS